MSLSVGIVGVSYGVAAVVAGSLVNLRNFV